MGVNCGAWFLLQNAEMAAAVSMLLSSFAPCKDSDFQRIYHSLVAHAFKAAIYLNSEFLLSLSLSPSLSHFGECEMIS